MKHINEENDIFKVEKTEALQKSREESIGKPQKNQLKRNKNKTELQILKEIGRL